MRSRYIASNSLLVLFVGIVLYTTLVSLPSVSSVSPQVEPTSLTTVEESTTYQPTVIVVVQPTTTTVTATSTITASTTIVSETVETVSVTQRTTESFTATVVSTVGMIAGMDPGMNAIVVVAGILGGLLGGVGVAWLSINLNSSRSNVYRTGGTDLDASGHAVARKSGSIVAAGGRNDVMDKLHDIVDDKLHDIVDKVSSPSGAASGNRGPQDLAVSDPGSPDDKAGSPKKKPTK